MLSPLSNLAKLIRLHSDLVRNSLSGVRDEDARSRPLARSNSMAFVAAHLVDARYFLAATIGSSAKSPFADLLDAAKSTDDVKDLPPVDDICSLWLDSEEHVLAALESATPEMLDSPSRLAFPIDDHTTLGVITFLVHHEAYHLGQLGLLRKGLGYGPMSYERR